MIEHYAKLADRVVVLISPKEKDGITAKTAEVILNLYLDDANLTNVDVEIAQAASPVRAAMEYGNSPEMRGAKIILGASTKGGDAAERFAGNVQKYVEDAEVLNPLDYAFDPIGEVLSATDFRNALRAIDTIERFLPDTSKDRAGYIADMVNKELKEVNEPFLGIFRGLVDEVLEEEEIEEISTSGGAAGSVGSIHGYSSPFGAKRRKRKKVSEKEVNEALNYLLQKLGV